MSTSLEPDQRFITVGCGDHATRVWDTARDELLAELPSVTPVEGDFASAFPAVSAAEDRAAIARGNIVEVYELPGGQLLRAVEHGAPVSTARRAHRGVFAARWVAGQILTAGSDSTARLWDPETGQLRRTYRGASAQFSDATISPDGSMGGGSWQRRSVVVLGGYRARSVEVAGARVARDRRPLRG